MIQHQILNIDFSFKKYVGTWLNGAISSFHSNSDFCNLLLTFEHSFDPDQDRLNVGRDLDLNHLTT